MKFLEGDGVYLKPEHERYSPVFGPLRVIGLSPTGSVRVRDATNRTRWCEPDFLTFVPNYYDTDDKRHKDGDVVTIRYMDHMIEAKLIARQHNQWIVEINDADGHPLCMYANEENIIGERAEKYEKTRIGEEW